MVERRFSGKLISYENFIVSCPPVVMSFSLKVVRTTSSANSSSFWPKLDPV